MTRGKTWCLTKSERGEVLSTECQRTIPVQQNLCHIVIDHVDFHTKYGRLRIVQFRAEPGEACQQDEKDLSFDPESNVSVSVYHTVGILDQGHLMLVCCCRYHNHSPPQYNAVRGLHLWPAASIISDTALDVWSVVRSSIVSVINFDTVRLAAQNTVTMTVIVSASPSARVGTIPSTSAYNRSHTSLRTHTDYTCFLTPTHSARWTLSLRMSVCSLKRIGTTCIAAAKKQNSNNLARYDHRLLMTRCSLPNQHRHC